MEGVAFKCDECGRVAFAPPPYVDDIPVPPSGWIGLSEVPPEGEPWKSPPHFCTWNCLSITARQRTVPDGQAWESEPSVLRLQAEGEDGNFTDEERAFIEHG